MVAGITVLHCLIFADATALAVLNKPENLKL